MQKPALLIIDDDKEFIDDFIILLGKDYNCSYKLTPQEGISAISENSYDLVLLDLMFKENANGLEVLKQIHKIDSELPVIMVTDYGAINTAIEAMKIGAYNYISKSPNMQELKLIISKALKERIIKYQTKELENNINKSFKELIGNSFAINSLKEKIQSFANNENTVIVYGESGVGKELVSRQIHYLSDRKNKPFIAINCAAVPKDLLESELFGHEKGAFTGAFKKKLGKFELAMDGTVFLDEIAELELSSQVKLLRVIQEKEFERVGGTNTIRFNARIIAATNKDLRKSVNDGSFREDLFYRLFVLPIEVPPLRERKEDIPILLEHFGKISSIDSKIYFNKFTDEAIQICKNYDWPGNIRELQNFVTRSIILANGEEIDARLVKMQLNVYDNNSPGIFNKIPQTWGEMVELRKSAANIASRKVEKIFLENILKQVNGNISKAAELIGINRTNLHKMINKCGINYDKG